MPNNFVITFLGRISTVALAFLTALFVTRYASKASAGLYFWLVSTVVFLNIPLSLGLNAVAAGALARCERSGGLGAAKRLAFVIVKKVLLAGGISSAGCGLLLAWAHKSDGSFLWLGQQVDWWVCAVVAASCYAFLFVASELYRYFDSVLMAVLCSGLAVGALNFMVMAGLNILGLSMEGWTIVGSYTGSLLVVAFFVLISLWVFLEAKHTNLSSSKADFDFLKICPPVVLTGICAYAITQAHTFIAVLVLGNEGSAEYNAAARLVLILGLLPGVIQSMVLPAAAKLHSKNAGSDLESLMRAGATASTLATVPLGLIFMVFPGETMGLVFGAAYSSPGPVLPLLSLGVVINTVRGFPGVLLMQCGHQGIQAKATVVGGIFAGICLLVAYFFRSDAAIAWAVAGGIFFQSGLEWWLSKRILGINTFMSIDYLVHPRAMIGVLNVR